MNNIKKYIILKLKLKTLNIKYMNSKEQSELIADLEKYSNNVKNVINTIKEYIKKESEKNGK